MILSSMLSHGQDKHLRSWPVRDDRAHFRPYTCPVPVVGSLLKVAHVWDSGRSPTAAASKVAPTRRSTKLEGPPVAAASDTVIRLTHNPCLQDYQEDCYKMWRRDWVTTWDIVHWGRRGVGWRLLLHFHWVLRHLVALLILELIMHRIQ